MTSTLWFDALNQGLIIGVFAISLNVLLGHAGVLSVATVGLGAIGGYTAGYLTTFHDWSVWGGLAAAIGAGLVVGLALGLPALRLGPDYVIVLTLAFATIVGALAAAIPDLGGMQGLIGIEAVEIGERLIRPQDLLRFTGPLTLVAFLGCWRLVHSPFGRVLRGIREDEVAVEALGKPVVRFKVIAFALTSAVAALAGGMLVFYQQLASPSQFSFATTTAVVAAVVIGGTGNLLGSLLGAIALSMIRPVLQISLQLPPIEAAQWQLVVFGLLVVLVLVLRPAGLLPERIGFRRAVRVASAAPVQVERTGSADEPVLVAHGVAKRFGAITAVAGLDLSLRPGQVTALLGPNGAGKTTVFNLLTGRTRADAGTVTLRGERLDGRPVVRGVARGMARTFQDVRTFERMSVLDNVRLAVPGQVGERLHRLYTSPLAVRRSERAATRTALHWLEYVGLSDRAGTPAGDLSFGDQKLLAFARALATGADVLLLDEPASGVDRGSLESVLALVESLRAAGRTICLVEHNLDVVERLADVVLFMEQGRVTATGSMAEITAIDHLEEVYFGRA